MKYMIFECSNVKRAYGKQKILRGISFSASGGEIVGFSGDNGCGKSTLLSILAGVERPDKGEVTIDGRSIYRIRNLSDRIGYVPQTDPLPGEFKVSECLGLWCGSVSKRKAAISDYDLTDFVNKRVSKLSGGMRRRVSLAVAAASQPDILILDEPTAALDMHYKTLIRSDIRRMAENGALIILVSHDIDELDMCNTCYRITGGVNEKI
ncbi:MAG: ABC transporter ATP-binding protein [Lachnospiraceae bacterium]|nr:ABC transporter ATP-binding protein [Lachnospiraceae bacterium]